MNFTLLAPKQVLTLKGVFVALTDDHEGQTYIQLQDTHGNVAAIALKLASVNLAEILAMLGTGEVLCTHVHIDRITDHVMCEGYLTEASQLSVKRLTTNTCAPGVVVGTIQSTIDSKLPDYDAPDGTAHFVTMLDVDLPYSWMFDPKLKKGHASALHAWFVPQDFVYVHIYENDFFKLSSLQLGSSVVFTHMEVSYFTQPPGSYNEHVRCMSFKTTCATAILKLENVPSFIKYLFGPYRVANTTEVAHEDMTGFTPVSACIGDVAPPARKKSLRKSPSPAISSVTPKSPTTSLCRLPPNVIANLPLPSMEDLLLAMQPVPTEVEDAPVVHRTKHIKAKSPSPAIPTPEKRPRPCLTWGIAPKSAVPGSAVQFKDGNDVVDATITGGGVMWATLYYGEGRVTKRVLWKNLKFPEI